MKRIAYICADPGVPVFGCKGSSIHVQEVVRAFLERGEQVDLFAPRFDGDPPPGLENVKTHRLPMPLKRDPAAREEAALEVNRILWFALKRVYGFDMVYERYSLWSFAGMAFARETGIPGVLEVNSPLIEEQSKYRSLVNRQKGEEVACKAFGAATVVVAVSKEVAAYLTKYPGLSKKCRVIPNGVNLDRFPKGIHASRPAASQRFTVGFVGTLKPWHGLTTLLNGFKHLTLLHNDCRLLIVGDGPERTRLQEQLSDLYMPGTIEWTGTVFPNKIPGLLASMDVAVAPYPDLPGFYFSPLKVYEYMAAGLPVVASCIGQLTELIEDGVNGILVPPDKPLALSAALEKLKSDPGMRAFLGDAARKKVCRFHTWSLVANRIFNTIPTTRATQASGFEEQKTIDC